MKAICSASQEAVVPQQLSRALGNEYIRIDQVDDGARC